MIRVPSIAFIASVVGCASAPGSPPAPAPSGAAHVPAATAGKLYANIPAQLGAFRLTERTTIRGLPTDSLFRFSDGSRTILTVIVYDVAADVRSGSDPQQWTAREGEKFKAVQDVRLSRGNIRGYELAYADTIRFTADAREILEHATAVTVRFPNGDIAIDMQYLYLIGGKFVKVRATIPERGWQQTRVPSFARELAHRMAREQR